MTEKIAERTEEFLNDFMEDMYPKKDHAIAREYFRDLFRKLIPRYFCINEEEDKNQENINKKIINELENIIYKIEQGKLYRKEK